MIKFIQSTSGSGIILFISLVIIPMLISSDVLGAEVTSGCDYEPEPEIKVTTPNGI
jgi:hypothetical protein